MDLHTGRTVYIRYIRYSMDMVNGDFYVLLDISVKCGYFILEFSIPSKIDL